MANDGGSGMDATFHEPTELRWFWAEAPDCILQPVAAAAVAQFAALFLHTF
jgi:hypothetical protein